MTTPTTPEQARDFAQSMWGAGAADDEVAMMRGLADQVEALTFANRDLINWYEALKFDYEALKTDANKWREFQAALDRGEDRS